MRRNKRMYSYWSKLLQQVLILAILAIAPLVAFFLDRIFKEPFADSLTFAREFFLGKWFTLVHFSSNAVFTWRIDPVLNWILDAYGYRYFFAVSVLIFTVGIYAVCDLLSNGWRPLLSALCASFCAVCLILMFGFDTLLISSTMWFPWVLFILLFVFTRKRVNLAFFVILLFLVLRLCKSANQVSLLLALSAFLAAYYVSDKSNLISIWTSFVLILVPSFCTVLRVPPPPLPVYPPYARVLEHRVPFLEGGDVLLGPVPSYQVTPVQIIDRAFIREALEPFCFVLMLLSFILILDSLRRSLKSESRQMALCGVLLLFVLSCLLDTSFVAPALSQISPLYTLQRIMPGLIYLPLIYPMMGISCVFLSMLMVYRRAGDILALLVLSLIIFVRWEGVSKEPYVQRRNGAMPWRELERSNLSEDERNFRKKALLSPSYSLISANAPDFFEKNPRVSRDLNFRALSQINHEITASSDTEKLQRLIKNKEGSRWSSGGGRQNATEWIHIRFAKKESIRGIKLEINGFSSDFPR
ncbi:MAG: YfhO family protein, partial [SAR324 cluster bacterium]|nr:YfhO family protein [SAR324 cluster bacterium]